MTEDDNKAGLELGVYGDKAELPRFGIADIIATVVSVLWVLVIGLVFLFGDGSGLVAGVMTGLVIAMPVALIWTVALAIKTSWQLREEAAHLQKSIDALRHAQVVHNQAATAPSLQNTPAPQNSSPSAPQRDPISTRPANTPSAAPSDPQPSLELTTNLPARDPITVEEFIRALNFPNDETDRPGFRALAKAMDDPDAGRLIRAAQDILTLLSQDGIYMDDLHPDRAKPETWRRFAEGERGKTVADLGGVRDRIPLGLTTKRMREDVVFRDAAHHFLRYFDKTFVAFAIEATDQEIADLSETRSARAFMLLGRVAGTFD